MFAEAGVLELQVVGVFVVGREAAGYLFELLVVFQNKTGSRYDCSMEGVAVEGDFFADAFQDGGFGAVEAGI